MNKKERRILELAITKWPEKGLLSPAEMINSIAHKDTRSVENLVVRGYLEYVPTIKGERKYNFFRVTEKGLNIFEPWYKRFWFSIKGDLHTIIVAVITAIITTILISFVN